MRAEISAEAMKEIRRLGSIGGKKSSANMTAEQRRERARKAVAKRWANKRETR